MNQYLHVVISDYTGTVEHFLRTRTSLTRRQISRAKFLQNGIRKNNIRCRVTEQLAFGDILDICLEDDSTDSSHLASAPSDMAPPEILFEDMHLIAVNKPSGVAVHPSGCHYNDTLANQVYFHCKNTGQKICCRAVGRLDKETSGIVIFAKNRPAASILQRQRTDGSYRKRYLAVVSGYLPADPDGIVHTIAFPLAPDPCRHTKMCIAENILGKQAVTHYQTLHGDDTWALVQLWLDTGRTHQIRVHMAAAGHPLLGDPLYGAGLPAAQPFSFSRTALHAWKTEFVHPFSGETIKLEASLPDDFYPVSHFLNG